MAMPEREENKVHDAGTIPRDEFSRAVSKDEGAALHNQTLPSFFIVGPPRTGTSWLHTILAKHAFLPTLTKETRFFDTHFHRGIDWYRAHFRGRTGDQPAGEVAPTYFASPEARERIASTFPEAKIVCIFRNPVERVLSLYRLKRAYGMISWGLEEAITRDPELMESSKYATHLEAWQRVLGKNQVLPTVYDDLRDQPQPYIDALVDFIGVPRFTLSSSQIKHVHSSEVMTHPRNYYWTKSANAIADWCKARQLDRVVVAVKRSPLLRIFLGGGPAFADLSPDTARKLSELFRPEVERLEKILNRDFSAWKSPLRSATVNRLSPIEPEEEVSGTIL
jgi:hypothetical protein